MRAPDIGLKILLALREKGIGQQELAKKAGVAQSTISLYMGNKRSPKFELLVRIARALDKPVSYFTEEDNLVTEQTVKPTGPRFVPVLDPFLLSNINWENGSYPPGDYTHLEPTESADRHAFYARASGENLTGWANDRKIIFEGDLLLVEPGKPVEDGDIVFCKDGDRGTAIKKFRRLSDRIILLPLNDNHSPVVFGPEEKLVYFKISEIKRKL